MPRLAVLRHQPALVSEPFVLEQAAAFSAYEPVLVTRDAPGPDAVLPVPAVSIAGHGGRRAAAAYATGACPAPLARLLAELRVDAVLAHFGVEGSFALPAARRLGLPLATVFHGFDATSSTGALLRAHRPAWAAYVARRPALRRHGDLFLPVSEHLRRRLLAQGFAPERTVTHHTGIDLSGLPAPQPGTDGLVVHVARLVEKKGTEHLLHAVALLVQRGVDVHLRCVGDGPLRGELERLTARLGIERHVELLGALPHAAALAEVARASVLCLPSVTARSGDQEGLGHVLLEAGALGVPVVASDSGGIPSAVRDGVTGRLVPEGDAPALAAALGELLEDPARARTLGEAGRALVRSSFDVRVQTRRLEGLLQGLR